MINGGQIINEASSKGYAIYNTGIGRVEINNGEVKRITKENSHDVIGAIYNKDTGIIKINGGDVYAQCIAYNSTGVIYGIHNATSGIIEINKGTINSNATQGSQQKHIYGIYNQSVGKIIVSGGIINGKDLAIEDISGNIVVESGKIEDIRSSQGDIEVKGGQIRDIYNTNKGTVKISGGETGIIDNQSIGLIKITGGKTQTIKNKTTGIVIIGDKDKEISQEDPIIEGIYGIGNSLGTVEFYSGRIKTTNSTVSGCITKIRDGYTIKKEVISEEVVAYLVEIDTQDYIVQVDDMKYYSLQKAINDIGENEEKTIKVTKDFDLKEVVKFNKNVILDLNGYKITNNFYLVENIGDLIITDSTESKEGTIEGIETNFAIINKGNINLEYVNIINSNSNNSYYNISCGIYNATIGELRINESEIISNILSNNYTCGIYNTDNGSVIVSKTNISSEATQAEANYGIYNVAAGLITVNEVVINSVSTRGDLTYGIYNESEGEITMIGGNISADSGSWGDISYGIYNNASGKVIIQGGTIKAVTDLISSGTTGGAYRNI